MAYLLDMQTPDVAGVVGDRVYTEVLIVYEPSSKKPLGNLEITLKLSPKGAATSLWKWNVDSGTFEWRQWGFVMYSESTNPRSYVWSLTNNRWHKGPAVELPRKPPPSWFICSDKIAVINEQRNITYHAKPVDRQYKCCKL